MNLQTGHAGVHHNRPSSTILLHSTHFEHGHQKLALTELLRNTSTDECTPASSKMKLSGPVLKQSSNVEREISLEQLHYFLNFFYNNNHKAKNPRQYCTVAHCPSTQGWKEFDCTSASLSNIKDANCLRFANHRKSISVLRAASAFLFSYFELLHYWYFIFQNDIIISGKTFHVKTDFSIL